MAKPEGKQISSTNVRAKGFQRDVAMGISRVFEAARERPPKLYRIGEVVDYSGVSRQTIHNYTTMGLLREIRWTAGGHRLYDESVFGRLDQINEFKAGGKSLQDIRDFFVAEDNRQRDEPLAVISPEGANVAVEGYEKSR